MERKTSTLLFRIIPCTDTQLRYIPGGRYPLLASAHMTILTAKVAGVKKVVACTPPAAGKIPNATVAAMHLAGADEIFILGGVQAVAAMAVGTPTVPKVDFIAGPGNAFVAEAKRQLFGEIGIDLFAGPTEVLIVADETADPFMVATDLLSQAEHGPDSPAVLITTSEEVGKRTIELCAELLEGLVTAPIASVSWRDFGEVVLAGDLDEAYTIADKYAYEHVQILTAQPREALEKMQNYGALFLGPMTCVSYGDKVSTQNHVLCLTVTSQLTSYHPSSALEPTTFFLPWAPRDTPAVCGWASSFGRSRTRRFGTRNRVASWDSSAAVLRG